MLNIEKYEKELREYGIRFALTKEGKPVSCSNFGCDNCAFKGSCTLGRMNWLLEEYKEPILTEEEKAIINDILKTYELFNHFNREKCVITKQFLGDEEEIYYLEIAWGDEKTATPSFWATNMFVGMDICKTYTLEELDLC